MPRIFKKSKSRKKNSKPRLRYMKKTASGKDQKKRPRLTLDLSKKDTSVHGRMLKEDKREVLKGDQELREKVFRGEMTIKQYNLIHKNGD